MLYPVIELIFPLFLGVAIGFTFRARGADGLRPGPAGYLFYSVSLVALVVGVFTLGLGAHFIAQLVGPTPQSGSSGGVNCVSPSLSGCSSGNAGSVAGASPFVVSSKAITNHFLSDAVMSFFFAGVALFGYLMAWSRARRLDQYGATEADARLAINYSYLVAGVCAVTLLVTAPLMAEGIFRASAPGVTAAGGRADGVRNLVTFLVVDAVLLVNLVYHLRLVGVMRRKHTAWSAVGAPIEPVEPPPSPGEGPYDSEE